ncbi:hypothetical protein [Micromonospora phaseoli]|uniref:hypothetical protein n=1 Tax=Micromonospora phaseoli TaxID=1144548 RepID=UPI000B87168E|nr:hypothetical protein [Micromonospora phaseoli]GIJ75742.1 hypothetical protein Xph01_01740 [Micromonospora phaseoli]
MIATAAALASVGRAQRPEPTAALTPANESRLVAQPPIRDAEPSNAERDSAWARANQARGLAAKEYLDERATPTGHPAAGKESRERHWTAADHSRWRRLALATPDVPRFASAARLTSVRSAGARGQNGPVPSPAATHRRQARVR